MGSDNSKLNVQHSGNEEGSSPTFFKPHSTNNNKYRNEVKSQEPDQALIQNFILVWLDSNMNKSIQDFQTLSRELQRLVSRIQIFNDEQECFKYIDKIKSRKVFMIVSGTIGRNIITQIEETALLETVYVFCANRQFHLTWIRKVPKIRDAYTDINLLSTALIADVKNCVRSMTSISYNKIDPMFLYTQLLKDAVIDIDDELNISLKDFGEYCRTLDDVQPSDIQEFIDDYDKHPPIWWYTREFFIYPMLNRGLFEMDVVVIQKMAFFIRDLQKNIMQLYREKHQQHDRNLFVVYRGQNLPIEAFEKIKKTKGDLMSFNNFLSTSRNYEISLEFAHREGLDRNIVGILFEMTIDPKVCQKSNFSYTSVAGVGFMDDSEQEILFTTHTLFRINDIKPIKNSDTQCLYRVSLALTNNENEDFHQLTERFKMEVERKTAGWCRFGYILLRLHQSEKALYIFEKLLDKSKDDKAEATATFYIAYSYDSMGDYKKAIQYYHKAVELKKRIKTHDRLGLANCFENLGVVYKNIGEYEKALKYHEEAIAIKKKILNKNHPDLASSYLNIGGVYRRNGDYKMALEYYEKSLHIKKLSLPESHPRLADSYMNIGLVYYKMRDFSKALKYYYKSVDIKEKSLPKDHPSLADSYTNLGLVYQDMNEFTKALDYHKKSIEIQKKSLPEIHPRLANSYNNIGCCLEHEGKFHEALEYIEKAQIIDEKCLPNDHPDAIRTRRNINRLRKRMK